MFQYFQNQTSPDTAHQLGTYQMLLMETLLQRSFKHLMGTQVSK